MPDPTKRLTVFRSADENAQDDAEGFYEILKAQGVDAEVLTDADAGVPAGAWEIRVPEEQAAAAEEILKRADAVELGEGDDSPDLDMETVFSASGGTTQELEATAVRSLLEDAGIPTVTVGDAVLPNLSFEIRVPRDQAERARQVIADAQVGGPAAAEEAERTSEAP